MDDIRKMVSAHVGEVGGVIMALRAIQSRYRCVPESADAIVADVFNLSRAEIRGVVSFYSDFTRTPKGKTVVRLCAAEACQAAGARSVECDVEKRLGMRANETSASGDVTLERVYCLGLCSAAPAASVGDRLVGRADAERVEAAIARASGDAT